MTKQINLKLNDKTLSEKEIELIDKIIELSLSKKKLKTEKDLMKVLGRNIS